MTTLATHQIDPDQLDMLALIADDRTPLGMVRMDDFRAACRADAEAHDGWVHPSRVSALLHDRFGEINPQSLSAKWAPACGPNGFLDKTNESAPIDPTHSRGNGNKDVLLRRWRVADADINWREFALSSCEYGCKVYRHDITREERVLHNSAYGCRQ